MSQVLQCRQFCALICSAHWPCSFDVEPVYASRAIIVSLARHRAEIDPDRDVRGRSVLEMRLVFLVVGVRQNRREFVEGEHAVRLRVLMTGSRRLLQFRDDLGGT